MAAKRSASAQLTSDNWQQEDDEEEEPVSKGFTKAPKEELQKRQMRTAKRTLTNGSSSLGGTQTGGKLFPAIDLTGGLMSSFGKGGVPLGGGVSLGGVSLGGGVINQSFPPPIVSPHQKDTNSKYIRRLCALNESVSRWIADHVKKNPCLDLTPVFEDYKKYLAELDVEREKEEKQVTSVLLPVKTSSDTMETGSAGLGQQNDNKEEREEEEEEDEKETPEMSSGSQEEATEKKGQLQLAPSAPLPPGCLMAVRSKLYYKKEEQYVELGIGKLQVEEIEKEDKGVRLLMRNDTTMGQILLNVRLSSSVPMTLQKNNLLIVCSPNPPLENKSPDKATPSAPPPPVTYVIKVKDVHLAKELYDTVKEKL